MMNSKARKEQYEVENQVKGGENPKDKQLSEAGFVRKAFTGPKEREFQLSWSCEVEGISGKDRAPLRDGI